MKRVLFPAAFLMIILIGSSFILPNRPADEVRELDPFSGIGISISADVFYTQGNTHEIRIEGSDRDVNDLITSVQDGFLKVRYDNMRLNRSKLTLFITSKALDAVKISGSAQFVGKKPVATDELDLGISGSGGINFSQLDSDEVGMKISGSGNIELEKGTADETDISISGSGDVRAEGFEVSECSVSLSGSGSVRILVTSELDAKMSGSGKVYYRGDPTVNSSSSGSGKTIKL